MKFLKRMRMKTVARSCVCAVLFGVCVVFLCACAAPQTSQAALAVPLPTMTVRNTPAPRMDYVACAAQTEQELSGGTIERLHIAPDAENKRLVFDAVLDAATPPGHVASITETVLRTFNSRARAQDGGIRPDSAGYYGSVFDEFDAVIRMGVPGAEDGWLEQEIPARSHMPAAQPDIYTIAWMSDTQHYSNRFHQTFMDMTAFLADSFAERNTGYIVHTGDLVNSRSEQVQWDAAVAAMDVIRDLPHGVLAGNHDVGSSMDYRSFEKYFGEGRFSGLPCFGKARANNRDHYDLFTLGKTDYLFVYLGYNPGKADIAWANEAFAAYPQRVGVLCVHDYIHTDSTLTEMGEELQRRVVAENPNVYMVLCGHRYMEDLIPAEFDDNGDGASDRTVYQCIANYQAADDFGGSGYIRFIEISESRGELRFFTYSPVVGNLRPPYEGATHPQSIWPLPWLDGAHAIEAPAA